MTFHLVIKSAINQTLQELRVLIDYYTHVDGKKPNFLGLALSARKNLCIHPEVSQAEEGKEVDSRCHKLTASFMREKHTNDPNIPVCTFYEVQALVIWIG